MNKAAAITGDVQFYDYARKNLIKSVPARGDAVFNYYFAQYTGDKRALSEESKRKLYNQPMPFPSDPEILLTATRELKRMISRIIHDNDKIFLNYYE